ncbi:MAG: hypothetical protein GYA21_15625 [Myxococcales bacterium]|nr:hypothetical protein [Myxococcales bacterium]
MRTRWTMISMCMMAALWLTALPVRAGDFELRLAVPKPEVTLDERGYAHVHIRGFLNLGHAGEPELPVASLQALIPSGERVESVTLLPAEPVEIPGTHAVYPKQVPWPLSKGAPPFTPPDARIYAAAATFPQRLFSAEPVQFLRGFAIQPVTLRPVVYNPAAKKLYYFPSLAVRVRTAPDPKNALLSDLYRGFGRDFEAVRAQVQNPEALSSYPARAEDSKLDYRYVVVTSQALASCPGANNLQALLTEKQGRGITTFIKTMEEIRTGYSGADDAAKVRAFLLDMYQNAGADFALLAGDADLQNVGGETQAPIVPVRGLCCYLDSYTGDTNIPSDLYYAALDGTFNDDGDGCWGEQTDGTDLLAELWVGRVPADNCTEIANFVQKTLNYRAASGDWLRKTYMVGEWLWDYYPGNNFGYDFLKDVHYSSTTDGYDTKGFSESTFYQVTVMDDQFEDGPNCSGQPSPCWSAQEMLAVLNGGNHIINHLGHSYTDYNMRLYCNDLASLTNTLPFFEYSQGCYPGAFDNRDDQGGVMSQDSFSEYMVLGTRGAFAAMLNTRYGLGWYSNYEHRYFWDAAFRENKAQIGEMHAYSQAKMSPVIWTDTGVQWVYYVANIFGDPEVTIHGILPLQGPFLNFQSREITSDGTTPAVPGPGRHIVMPITLRNIGTANATGIVATLTTSSPQATITQANPTFATIAAGASGRSTTHAAFDISNAAADGAVLDFSLAWTAAGGYSGTVRFSVSVQRARIVYLAHTVDDSAGGCDTDGVADAGEPAVFAVTLQNQGSAAASNVVANLTASNCSITGPANVGAIPAGGTAQASFTVTPGGSIACPALAWPFSLSIQAAELPQPDTSSFATDLNADIQQSLFGDDMEGSTPNGWTHSASIGADDWAKANTSYHSPSRAWFCSDPGTKSEKFLMTPAFSIGGNTQMSFWHRMESEANYDGGVLEISVNGGAFQDLGSVITQGGYNDTVDPSTDSTLVGRPVWAGTVAWQEVRADLSSFGPASVVIRFRFASDSYVAGSGWWIDDFSIDTRSASCQQQSCNQAPVVNAGADQNVQSGTQVRLSGNASDPGGLPLTITWSQTAGPVVTLSDTHSLSPTFTAPAVSNSATLTFLLTASNGQTQASDSVNVTVWNCSDNEPCTNDSFTGSGCNHAPLADCTACGAGGACMSGVCQASGPVVCDDGNACTRSDTCQNGQCVGAEPVACQPLDACHDAGTCDPSNGACSNPPKPNGSPCDDGNACSVNDACRSGVCVPGEPVTCPAADDCHQNGSCDPQTGQCSNPEKPNGTPCDDHSVCTENDECRSGVCTGGSTVTCTPPDACHGAVCNPQSGGCEFPLLDDGTPCDDGDACTQNDACQAGACTSGAQKVCEAQDSCHEAGTCDPQTGECSNPVKADGAECDDGDGCTQGDTCRAGACTAGEPVTCQAQDACHEAGNCDPLTGSCSNPAKADGSACDDGDACTRTDACQAGVCTGADPVTCQPPDECHQAACNSGSGACDVTTKADGTACSRGTCQNGVCTEESSSGSGCGCATGASSPAGVWLLLLPLFSLRRRRAAGR